jgi:hypothetical protein
MTELAINKPIEHDECWALDARQQRAATAHSLASAQLACGFFELSNRANLADRFLFEPQRREILS